MPRAWDNDPKLYKLLGRKVIITWASNEREAKLKSIGYNRDRQLVIHFEDATQVIEGKTYQDHNLLGHVFDRNKVTMEDHGNGGITLSYKGYQIKILSKGN